MSENTKSPKAEQSDDCPSVWRWERYIRGWCDAATQEAMAAHLTHCSVCCTQAQALGLATTETTTPAETDVVESVVSMPALVWDAQTLEDAACTDARSLPEPTSFATPVDVTRTSLLQKQAEPSRGLFVSFARWLSRAQWPVWAGVTAMSFIVSMVSLPWIQGGGSLIQGRDKGATKNYQRRPQQGRQRPGAHRAANPGFRIKGQFAWQLFAHSERENKSRIVAPGESVGHGEALRFQFILPRPCRVLVFSINEEGKISLYFPYPSTEAVRIGAGTSQHPEAQAIPLDNYEGHELFWVLASSKAFALDSLKVKIREAFLKSRGKLREMPSLPGFLWQSRQLVKLHKNNARGTR